METQMQNEQLLLYPSEDHDIAEILLKVALFKTPKINQIKS
jgi:hypothetical protein